MNEINRINVITTSAAGLLPCLTTMALRHDLAVTYWPPTRARETWYSFEREASLFLVSTWQQQCPRPTILAKPETCPAGTGNGGTLRCWCSPPDFCFFVRPLARFITRCGLKPCGLPSARREAMI